MTSQLPLAFEQAQPRRRRAAALEHYHAHGSSPTVDEALDREKRCKGQERRLLTWWREHPKERLTRYSAAEVLQLTTSSGGRALSNLAAAGYLRKRLDLRVDGPCGASCHPYELVEGGPS